MKTPALNERRTHQIIQKANWTATKSAQNRKCTAKRWQVKVINYAGVISILHILDVSEGAAGYFLCRVMDDYMRAVQKGCCYRCRHKDLGC